MKSRATAVLMAICAFFCASASDFDSKFADATLRIDVSLTAPHLGSELRIDSIAQWSGWYGRRVNLATPPYGEALQVTLREAVTGEVIYSDAKCLNTPEGMQSDMPSYGILFVPKPLSPAVVEVAVNGYDEDGWGVWKSISRTLDASTLATLQPQKHLEATPYKTLRRAADAHNFINLAFVAEGYRSDEMDEFMCKAVELDSALFMQPAFRDMAARFNVVAVMLPSAESGISKPSGGIVINSALGAHFDSFNLDRLITIPDTHLMWDALEGVPAQYVMVLANTEQYGGSGPTGEYAIASAGNPYFTSIIIHEFGHSFASLGDEYESGYSIQYTSDVEPAEPNITTLHDFGSKWQNLVDSGEASLIEGGGYQEKGVWRGCEKCLMRTVADHDFCVVCNQAISRVISSLTEEKSDCSGY